MNDTDFLQLLMRHQDGVLTLDEIAALEAVMRDDPAKRQLFAGTQLHSMALHDSFRQASFEIKPVPKPRSIWTTRPIAAMAAGLVIGLFSASIVWAISAPRATTERLFSLSNGSFDEQRVEVGFPSQIGVWSGDEASIADGKLRFVATGSDSNDPSAQAISCDVFQLVDLRPLRHTLNQEGDNVLELSASFIDARPHNTKPSFTFFCQLYLFKGDPAAMHLSWPQSIFTAVASGSAQATTLGTDAQGLRNLTAKCLAPAEADFAVVQIAARPNIRPAKLEQIFADEVKLTLKSSPELPIRILER